MEIMGDLGRYIGMKWLITLIREVLRCWVRHVGSCTSVGLPLPDTNIYTCLSLSVNIEYYDDIETAFIKMILREINYWAEKSLRNGILPGKGSQPAFIAAPGAAPQAAPLTGHCLLVQLAPGLPDPCKIVS